MLSLSQLFPRQGRPGFLCDSGQCIDRGEVPAILATGLHFTAGLQRPVGQSGAVQGRFIRGGGVLPGPGRLDNPTSSTGHRYFIIIAVHHGHRGCRLQASGRVSSTL